MSAVKIILALSLALVLSLGLVGCNGEGVVEDGEDLTQAEIDQIITGVTTAEYDTVEMTVDMTMTMEVVGGEEPGKVTVRGDGTGVMDIANQEMQMTMTMTMDIPEIGVQTVATESYLVGEWMYTAVDVPEMGKQWLKMEVPPGTWQQQNQVEQQMEFLRSAVKIEYLNTEPVDGTDCYVFEVVPSVETLGELLSQQSSAMGGIDFSQYNLADLFEEMSVKEWIARDSYQVLKTEVYMRMRMLPEDVGATGADFDKMVVDMDIAVRLYDYNQPVSIVLPPEAADAMEMPY